MHRLWHANCGKFTINVSLTARIIKCIIFYTYFTENSKFYWERSILSHVITQRWGFITRQEAKCSRVTLSSLINTVRVGYCLLVQTIYVCMSISLCNGRVIYQCIYFVKVKLSLLAKICFSHQWKPRPTGTNVPFLQKLCCVSLPVCLNHEIDNYIGLIDGIRPGIFIEQYQ